MKNQYVVVFLVVAFAAGGACNKEQPKIEGRSPKREGKVTILSEPSGAAVFTDLDRRLGQTPLTLQRPEGTVLKLKLVKEGRAVMPFSVIVEGSRQKKVYKRLARQTGTMVVRAGPIRGARIFVDGQKVGRVPEKIPLVAGVEHQVEVRMKGFHSYRERVTVKPGELASVSAILIPDKMKAPKMGWLSVESPTPAVVQLNGAHLGVTPIRKAPLPPGPYQLRVFNEGTKEAKTLSVTIKAQQENKVRVELTAANKP